jgi:hypothetical protein
MFYSIRFGSREKHKFHSSLSKKKASNTDAYNYIDDFEGATFITSTVTISIAKKKV